MPWPACGALLAGLMWAGAAFAYTPITPTAAASTVVLSGRDLTLEGLVAIARGGAKVQLSPAARAQAKDTYGLLLEAAAEGVPVYLFNRGGGTGREVVAFTGDPTAPDNQAKIAANQLRQFQNGSRAGAGPEMDSEAEVRAMMAVRANTMVYDGPSPALMQMLLDLLNARITPVVQSMSGTVGEADIALMQNVAGAMAGRGEVYLNGVRMPAAEALAKAGLKPLVPFGADTTALTSTNAYTASQAALLAYDGEQALQWADVIYAMDLLGMDSSITPLAAPTQMNRPEPWLNWHAGRMLQMLKGSYLFEAEPKRIIQDPDSLRASSIRQGSAWRAWAQLREAALFQINSSDHNPTLRVGLQPSQSWELSTPMMMQYYVKGGPLSGGKSGYIVSTANWDPYPLANQVEGFTLALGEMDAAVVQRVNRFDYPFHTGVRASEVLSAAQAAGAAPRANTTTLASYWAMVLSDMTLVAPMGMGSDEQANGDVMSQVGLKVAKSRRVLDGSLHLLAQDLMTASYWMDVRRTQEPKRVFGGPATAAWTAWRKLSPWGVAAAERPERPIADDAYRFLRETSPADIAPLDAPLPG